MGASKSEKKFLLRESKGASESLGCIRCINTIRRLAKMVRRASLSIRMVKTTYIGTAEEETEARDTYVERACTREEHKMRSYESATEHRCY